MLILQHAAHGREQFHLIERFAQQYGLCGGGLDALCVRIARYDEHAQSRIARARSASSSPFMPGIE
jgi:hypothetical protein